MICTSFRARPECDTGGVSDMALTVVAACQKNRASHNHVACWNCGKDHCLGISMRSYACSCECGETQFAVMVKSDPAFDTDFAASRSSPA